MANEVTPKARVSSNALAGTFAASRRATQSFSHFCRAEADSPVIRASRYVARTPIYFASVARYLDGTTATSNGSRHAVNKGLY